MLALALAFVGLFFSIIYCSSEIALITANRLQMKVWLKQKKKGARLGYSILLHKEEYLSTILVGNNLANILATSFATVYLVQKGMNSLLIVLLITSIILLFGEILPKTIIRDQANISLIFLAPILFFSRALTYPFNYLLRKSGQLQVANYIGTADQLAAERDDLQYVYKQLDDPDMIEKDQQEMISNVFEFGETSVSDAITPRTEISAIAKEATIEQALEEFIRSGHSKLPVYEDDIDNIKGVVHVFDFFKNPNNIQEITKPILFVPFSKSVMMTLTEFQTANHVMAIVLDEHGGTAGLVTAEDLFEELFGEFEDEFDVDVHNSEQISDGSILASAGLDWEVFNEKYGAIIPEGDYETIGGYVIKELGRIPYKGERFTLPIGEIVIRKSAPQKIEKLQIFLKKN